jgi:hypothetical protein
MSSAPIEMIEMCIEVPILDRTMRRYLGETGDGERV